jgi:hypothetical protein
MTLKLENGKTIYNLYFNLSNEVIGIGSLDWRFRLKSQHSNLYTLDTQVLIDETNSRYTKFTLEIPSDMPEKHLNGIYDYELEDYANGIMIETGLLKLISGSGGTMDTQSYVSDNENNENEVYYRPNY